METIPLAEAKTRLSELVATVHGTWERVVITKNGRPVAVLVAHDDLDTLLETLDVLSDPDALAAIRQADDGGERTTGEEMAALMTKRLGKGAA